MKQEKLEEGSDCKCCVCGRPGKMRVIPDSQISSCYCDRCMPRDSFSILKLLFWVAVLAIGGVIICIRFGR